MARRTTWLVLLFLLLLPGLAAANGMPAAADNPSGGGVIQPAADTPVSVLSEHLLLDLREREGLIRATYRLQNQSPEPLEVLVAFAVPSNLVDQSIQVSLDGLVLPHGPVQPAEAPAVDLTLSGEWLDPFTGERYTPKVWRRPGPVQFVSFTLPFGAGHERHLTVEYRQHPLRDRTRFIESPLRYDYLLLPARHWAGFGALEIAVLVPPGRSLHANLPLVREGPDRYRLLQPGLPDQNLSVFLAPVGGAGLPGSWWWRRATRPWIIATIVALGALAGGLVSRSQLQKRHWIGLGIALVTGAAACLSAPLYMFAPNGGSVFTLWFLFDPAMIALALLVYQMPRWLPTLFRPPSQGGM